MFTNLLHNALRFTPELGHITLQTRLQNEPDGHIVAAIRDIGPGIASDALPDLFFKFRRATANGYQEGTGLGLFITKELVEAHAGWIQVKSTLGEGSCFSVCLPIGRES